MKKSAQKCSCDSCACCTVPKIAVALFGVGLGVLITYSIVGSHPMRWGFAFIILALILYFYPMIKK